MPLSPSPSPSLDRVDASPDAPLCGPVTRHRIAMIRRRLAERTYPVLPAEIAEAIVAYPAGDGRIADGGVTATIVAVLADGLTDMSAAASLVLQLEFIELLTVDEIGAVMGADSAAIIGLRRDALARLGAWLSLAS